MSDLPQCPDLLPASLSDLLTALARGWAESPARPRLEKEVVEHWDNLIEAWSQDPNLPLLVRKMSAGRGLLLRHHTGRHLVPTDNSPANWVFTMAYAGVTPGLAEIRDLITRDEIPVGMALRSQEREHARFTCTRLPRGNPNQMGWKICHKVSVGLRTRQNPVEIDIAVLQRHFRRFLSPSNLFLVPKNRSGLGELPELTRFMEGRY